MKNISIQWDSEETYWLIAEDKATSEVFLSAKHAAPELPGHIWLQSSGTSGKQKWVALSKKAILASAEAVNQWISSTNKDIWWLGISSYRVGGLAILARAFLSESNVVYSTSDKWSVFSLLKDIDNHKITLISLVPTQIYDLISLKISPPASVRVVFVGGGFLAQDLYDQALALGWPLLCTFAMTEASSQIACHSLTSPMKTSEFLILPHMEVKNSSEGMLVRSSALLSGQLERTKEKAWKWVDPKKDGWLHTEDLIELDEGLLRLKGRQTNSVKILGELVQIEEVEVNFRNFVLQKNPALLEKSDFIISPTPDARQENALALFVEGEKFYWQSWMQSISDYNQKQKGPWRIDRIAWIGELPRNEMGKVQRQEFKAQFY